MRTRVFLSLCLSATIAVAQTTPPAAANGAGKPKEGRPETPARLSSRIPDLVSNAGTRIYPLMNVDVVDSRGAKTSLVAFHRISGENVFRGFLGAADIEVPYARVSELRIKTPAVPGGAKLCLTARTPRQEVTSSNCVAQTMCALNH